MKRFLFIQRFLLLSLCLVLCWQCQKDENIVQEGTTPSLFLAVNATSFTQLLETDRTDFRGVFVKITANNILLERVDLENNLFVPEAIERPTHMEVISIDETGQLTQLAAPVKVSKVIEEDFDLVYFNWEDLKVLAHNSEQLFFSEASFMYGSSIHTTEKIDAQKRYTTIKVEGDFKKAPEVKNTTTSTPMFLIGLSCPPTWN